MDVREEILNKANQELAKLASLNLVMAGNAFSQVLLLKGEPEDEGAELLSAEDGKALRSALMALGYAPEDWAGLSVLDKAGSLVAPDNLRLAITTFDPNTIIALDDIAANSLREAYADELVELTDLSEATLQPGVIVHILGMRVLALGGFRASLSDQKEKRVMWKRLQGVPPLGEPY